MIIKKPEDTDLFFKKKLAQLPVDYNEADWGNLDKLLDQSQPAGSIKPRRISAGKLIVIVSALIIIAVSSFIWLKYKSSDEKNTKNDTDRIILKKDSVPPLFSPESPAVKKEKENIPVKTKPVKKESLNNSEPVVKDTLKEIEENKHVFW